MGKILLHEKSLSPGNSGPGAPLCLRVSVLFWDFRRGARGVVAGEKVYGVLSPRYVSASPRPRRLRGETCFFPQPVLAFARSLRLCERKVLCLVSSLSSLLFVSPCLCAYIRRLAWRSSRRGGR